MILINGNIINFSGENYSWIRTDGKKIAELGYGSGYERYAGSDEEIIDLRGRSLLPGFYDSHVHLDETVINENNIDFSEAVNFGYIEKKLRAMCDDRPDKKIIMGLSLHYHTLEERRLPTRRELDRMCPNYPVWIASRDLQRSVVNSRALELIKVPFSLNGIQEDEDGVITGILEHEANAYAKNKIMNLYTFEEKCSMIRDYINQKILPMGVTTVVAIETSLIREREDYQKFLKFIKKLPVNIELYYSITDTDEIKARKMKRMGGDIGVDGSFTSRNAALFENYEDVDGNGDLYFSQEELNRLVLECYEASLQIGLHAVGDRAFEQVLSAHEYAQAICPGTDLRHRVEHAELLSFDQIKRAKKLNLVLSMQPVFETLLGNTQKGLYEGCNELYVESLGERHLRTNMFRQILDEGIVICAGSDSALTPVNPLLGIYSAVNHPKKDHAVTLIEAIKMFTSSAAYATFSESERGSIARGKKADLTVLDKDIQKVKPESIKDISVDITIRDGKIVYSRKREELL